MSTTTTPAPTTAAITTATPDEAREATIAAIIAARGCDRAAAEARRGMAMMAIAYRVLGGRGR
jgi:hypothetical protein